ncbi:hypothetical protein BH23ACI1_BH23ACI1_07320 [soil metagenome]
MIGVTTIARGEGSRMTEPRQVVVRDDGEWVALWAAHAGPSVPAPPVDFSTRMVVAAFAGERPMPGHEIHIVGTRPGATSLAVLVEERMPLPGTLAAQMVVTPFHIASVPRQDGDVRFVAPGAAADAPVAPLAHVSDDAPSSTGLDREFAAALAYLAGPFSGMTILLAERRNRYVRFHAWQAVLGLGGLGLLTFLLLLGAFAGLVVSPEVFTTLYRLAFATLAVWVVLWIVLIVQAFTGRAWRLPLVGKAAARRAERI